MLPNTSWDMWEEVNNVLKIDENFAALRAILKTSSLPAIPYLGMFVFLPPSFIQ
jgi:hypothetical protein